MPASVFAPARSAGPRANADASPLDLHEGVSDIRPASCSRWPANYFLRSEHGELVRGRCRATNLCAYCARLAAVENAEVLALDAVEGVAPTHWLVLTTSRAELDAAAFYARRAYLVKALRRAAAATEYAALVEFTTGYGPRSGGGRRPHWNVLLKGVKDGELVRAIVDRVWCAEDDALPQAQHVGQVDEAGGLMRYLALHFQKESQAPPQGWRGIRFVKSRGYLWLPTAEARKRAQASLRLKRELWRAEGRGLTAGAALEAAETALARAEATSWTFGHRKRALWSTAEDAATTRAHAREVSAVLDELEREALRREADYARQVADAREAAGL